MRPGCIGKSNTNNLPAPTDLTENPYGKKKLFFNDATQKSATLVLAGIAIELEPTWPIFEKCSHLREKGGVLTKIWHSRNRLSRTVCLRRVRSRLPKIRNIESKMFYSPVLSIEIFQHVAAARRNKTQLYCNIGGN